MPLIIIRSGTVTRYAGSVLPASTNLLSGGVLLAFSSAPLRRGRAADPWQHSRGAGLAPVTAGVAAAPSPPPE
jgi:hypothetical protein